MVDFFQAIKLANRSQRVVDELAQEVASLTFDDKKDMLRDISKAMQSLNKVKETIIRHDPNLEYHFDSNRPPTKYMKEINLCVSESEKLIKSRDYEGAIAVLTQAIQMEPPPVIYEALVQKIEQAKRKM